MQLRLRPSGQSNWGELEWLTIPERQSEEILKDKKGTIKDAPLEEGSPGWDEILELTWEEMVKKAKERQPGFTTIKKLLSKSEYDKRRT